MNEHTQSADPDQDRTVTQEANEATATLHPTTDSTRPHLPDPPAGSPTIVGYHLTGEIGKGGMGRVFAAVDLKFDREVAVKTLLPGANVDRFMTESKITGKLPHPNIPPVHDLGTLPDGTPFLAMKLVRGETLSALLKARPNPLHDLSRFVQIFEQIAQAVGFAHSRGVIHRDLKPLNVMVGEFGEVQVMDWGVAHFLKDERGRVKDESVEGASFIPRPSSFQTSTGAILGTPGYMAPEQARSEPLDARADVFALGANLATILTGQPAFLGTTPMEAVKKSGDADLSDVFARLDSCGADAELIAIAKRCLSADRKTRPSDARAVATEVAAYRAGVEARLKQAETDKAKAETKATEQRKRRRVLRWAGGMVVGLLILGMVGVTVALFQARESGLREEGLRGKAEKERDSALEALDLVTTADHSGLTFSPTPAAEERRKFLDRVVTIYQRFLEEVGNDERSVEKAATAAFRMSLIQRSLGRPLEAEAAARKAVGWCEELFTRKGGGQEFRIELANALHLHATVLHDDLGRSDEAEAAMRRAVAHYDWLEEHVSRTATFDLMGVEVSDTRYTGLAGGGHLSLGNLLSDLGRAKEAEEHVARAVPMCQKAKHLFSTHTEASVGWCLVSHAKLLHDRGEWAAAEALCREALAGIDRQLSVNSHRPYWQWVLARCRHQLAAALGRQGRTAEAIEHLQQGLVTANKLNRDHPRSDGYRVLLAEMYSALAEQHTRLGSLAEAATFRQSAKGVSEQLVNLARRASSEFNLNDSLPRRGRQGRVALEDQMHAVAERGAGPQLSGRQWYTVASVFADFAQHLAPSTSSSYDEDAVSILKHAVRKGYRNADRYADDPALDFARADPGFDALLTDVGVTPPAGWTGRDRLTRLGKRVADHPNTPTYRTALADAHTHLGLLFAAQSLVKEPPEQFEQAIEVRERLVAEHPTAEEHLVGLGVAYCTYAHQLRHGFKNGNKWEFYHHYPDAVIWYGKGIDTLRPVYEKNPLGVAPRVALRNCHWGRALAYLELGKDAEAVADWDRAVELALEDEGALNLNAASAVWGLSDWPAEQWYVFAAVYAQISGRLPNDRQKYGDRAMDLLRRAVRAGWRETAVLQWDQALDPLRHREDFNKLFAAMKKKWPPDNARTSSPWRG